MAQKQKMKIRQEKGEGFGLPEWKFDMFIQAGLTG